MMGHDDFAHSSVLYREVLEYCGGLSSVGDGIVVDCTLGEGGHTEMILGRFPDIKVVGFERDDTILDVARNRLEAFSGRVEFVNDNFSAIDDHLRSMKGRVSGFLYDFGISSYHFDRSGRGFSFQRDEYLDMRLGKTSGKDAAYVINNYSENELTDIIKRYGEERWAKRIARFICRKRSESPVERTTELADIVLAAIPARFHVKNIHPATRVFQALRIEVNDELSAIEESLQSAVSFLAPGGRMMAISFHSLEDRIVKNIFRRLSKGCTCDREPQYCQCDHAPYVRLLTKKPLLPKDDEIAVNKRSRSAKMRVCEAL
ncbi:MAG TPA: 16S rRNA (cytosine(1402)-N(4))-methyltransferase RsmH [Spirochaetota bacterium]|nr:16S rRNA (cytosine(1402)-N(4))-methyltransferase RsmH [Spirochaetota bacterium]HPQ53374.1 16S rRNA (cytosine(1402)-N(4))-methyltransferase RsmH [Spirochaetota bacterium]